MVCTGIIGFKRACAPVVGGNDLLLIGDASDFDFTLAAPDTDGSNLGYSAIARMTGATAIGGAMLFEINSQIESIGAEFTQTPTENFTSAWEYIFTARLSQMGQSLTNFNEKIDAAAACCQLLIIWRTMDGKIFVAGEKFVGGVRQTAFRIRQDGSKMQSGKKLTEHNGQDLSLKGAFRRPPYEYTGGMTALQAFIAP
jgi:hypothetical protein